MLHLLCWQCSNKRKPVGEVILMKKFLQVWYSEFVTKKILQNFTQKNLQVAQKGMLIFFCSLEDAVRKIRNHQSQCWESVLLLKLWHEQIKIYSKISRGRRDFSKLLGRSIYSVEENSPILSGKSSTDCCYFFVFVMMRARWTV